jgi:hypothetical protein
MDLPVKIGRSIRPEINDLTNAVLPDRNFEIVGNITQLAK